MSHFKERLFIWHTKQGISIVKELIMMAYGCNSDPNTSNECEKVNLEHKT